MAKSLSKEGINMPGDAIVHKNFMLALMEAVSKDQNTLSLQEIQDAQSTEASVKLEEGLYGYYNVNPNPLPSHDQTVPGGLLGYDAFMLKQAAENHDQDGMTRWQSQYQADAARGQGAEGQLDGVVQSGQGQTSSDGANLGQKAELARILGSIATTTANLLGRLSN
jgi:hypothetical protein